MPNINTGVQRSQGVEFDMSGAITPSIKVIANGAYTDATVRSSTDYAKGNKLTDSGVTLFAYARNLTEQVYYVDYSATNRLTGSPHVIGGGARFEF